MGDLCKKDGQFKTERESKRLKRHLVLALPIGSHIYIYPKLFSEYNYRSRACFSSRVDLI